MSKWYTFFIWFFHLSKSNRLHVIDLPTCARTCSVAADAERAVGRWKGREVKAGGREGCAHAFTWHFLTRRRARGLAGARTGGRIQLHRRVTCLAGKYSSRHHTPAGLCLCLEECQWFSALCVAKIYVIWFTTALAVYTTYTAYN